jgi:hypothetical protein
VAALTGNRGPAESALRRSAEFDGVATGEELFLLALAAAWIEQPDLAEVHLVRGLEWYANHPFDHTLQELAVDALDAVRKLDDTAAINELLHPK